MRRILTTSALSATRAFSGSSLLMAKVIPFNLADIGEGILQVEVLQVFVKEGDTVKAFDKICEVQSDKATVEITSRYDGVVKAMHISKGATAFVGKPIADLEVDDSTPGEAVKKTVAPAKPAAPSSSPAAPSSSPAAAEEYVAKNGKVLATPATRRIAMENKIDLTKVRPTGKGGRIMKEDVIAYMEGGQAAAPASSAPKAVAGASVAAPQDYVVSLTSGVRRGMVKSMTIANEIPAFGACDEICMDNIIRAREALKPIFKARGIKITFLPFFMKAASLALLQFPEINAHTNRECTELIVKGSHNISFAMDSAQGLIVPNIKDVQNKTLFQIAEDLAQILEKGKSGQVARENLEGGTFTLSNIGGIGATYTAPVIFAPQVAIGALGAVRKLPRFNEKGEVFASSILNVSWAADHRVVDGASMVRFNNLFKQYLENPITMLASMK